MAAITAALAFLAEVIGTGILGAVDANLGGGFVTDAALEGEGLGHGQGPLNYFAGAGLGAGGALVGALGGAAATGFGAAGADRAGGWRISVPRQRWASRSTV